MNTLMKKCEFIGSHYTDTSQCTVLITQTHHTARFL